MRKLTKNFSVERKADWSKYSYSKCALRPPTREASRGGDLARSQKDVCFTKTSCLLRTDAGARAATQLQKTGSPKFSKLALILLGFQFPYFLTQKAQNLQDTFANSNDWHFPTTLLSKYEMNNLLFVVYLSTSWLIFWNEKAFFVSKLQEIMETLCNMLQWHGIVEVLNSILIERSCQHSLLVPQLWWDLPFV